VEDYVFVLIIALIGVFSLIGARMFKPNQAKNKVKEKKESANQSLFSIYDDQIQRLKLSLRSESGRANRLQALRNSELEIESEEEGPGTKKPVSWEEITALVKAKYPNHKYLKLLPLVKDQVMEATSGMTMEEILNYVKEFTGDQESQGISDPQSAVYNPNWA